MRMILLDEFELDASLCSSVLVAGGNWYLALRGVFGWLEQL